MSNAECDLTVGPTREAAARNAQLLTDYDYEQYVSSLTGFSGQDRQRIFYHGFKPALRVRIGSRRNFKPAMACLPSGKLVIATFRFLLKSFGSGPAHQKYEVRLYESRDKGVTWKRIEDTNLSLCIKEPSLVALPDGALILTGEDPVHQYGPGDGKAPVCRSEDEGRTWETVMVPGKSHVRNIIVEADGSLLIVRNFKYGGDNPNLQLCRSVDRGATWQFSEGTVDWNYTHFGEVCPIRLRDGRLMAALRRQIPGTHGEGFQTTVITESEDDGKTWTKPRQMTAAAEVHVFLTELNDGRILATYTNYHLPFGIFAVISDDHGKTWDLDDPIRLALSADLNVGWPVTLELADNKFVTAYGSTTHLRPGYVDGPYGDWSPEKVSCEVVCWEMPNCDG